jgi:hypothetical protein
MTQASNLAKGGSNFNSTGNLNLTTGVTGILPVANGGTGTTSSTGSGAVVLATSPTITTPTINQINTSVANTSLGAGNASAMKNRIINGAMVISQRNGTSSVTPTNGQYVLDRFQYNLSQTSKITTQQSSTAPVGFVNSLLVTSSSAYSVTSTDYFTVTQPIEGFNVADLGWGTANAKTVTLSAWVYSSLTGTFGGSILNGSFNYAYPFTYSIPTANTWTQISVTIAGPTAGTWTTDNSSSVQVNFSLGSGSTRSGTAGAWNGSFLMSATGATSVVGTSGATWYVTGVQLEVGSSATGFEYRQYTTEFTLCQRYYQKLGNATGVGNWYNNTAIQAIFNFPVIMRTAPTASMTGALTFFDGKDQITETSGQVNDSDLCETGGRCNIGNFPSNTVQYRFYEFASPFSNNRYATFSAEL